MSISFLFNIDLEKPSPPSHRSSYINEYTEDPKYSRFEVGLIKFCNDYHADVSMFFEDECMEIDLWHDIWDLITYEIFSVMPALKNKRKMSFGFMDYGCMISSCEYYENKVRLKYRTFGCKENYEYFTECDVNELIEELLKLVNSIISLAVEGNYVDPLESNEFLAQIDTLK
jgi:hypothetical protein